MPSRRPFVGGNWKMNTTAREADALAGAAAGAPAGACQVAIYPPFVYLDRVASAFRTAGATALAGAQDLDHRDNGAFTGQVSASMLLDLGVASVLTGHSERRHVMGESDELVGLKTAKALNAGLVTLLCIGETLDEREAGKTDAVNERQLRAGLAPCDQSTFANLVIAYEPVWAIGTGRTASPEDAQNAHEQVRHVLSEIAGDQVADETRILYGGSVKPSNAAELFAKPDIDGGLIGGASLNASDFAAIISAAAESTSITATIADSR